MRGSRRIGLLAISVVCLFAFMASSAFAVDELLTKEAAGTRLREYTTTPVGFPDSLEFVNKESVVLKVGELTNTCTEMEFGTFVKTNPVGGPPVLSLPWGVAEGDNCTFLTYFGPATADAAHPGALETSVTIKDDEPLPNPIHAEVTKLSFAILGTPVGTCIYGTSGVEPPLVGNVTTTGGPYGEEGAVANLTVSFSGRIVQRQAGSAELCPKEGELNKAVFILETPSTNTDGAFYS
jgi:hypothetical protein